MNKRPTVRASIEPLNRDLWVSDAVQRIADEFRERSMLIGYARVWTAEQDISPQLAALREAGYEKIFSDKASGAKTNRAGLADALSHARAGDVLVV